MLSLRLVCRTAPLAPLPQAHGSTLTPSREGQAKLRVCRHNMTPFSCPSPSPFSILESKAKSGDKCQASTLS